jgi:hypothetical protein
MNEPLDHRGGPELRDEDAASIDRLVECGFDEGRVDNERDRRVLAALRVLDRYPTESSDPSLIDATLARIDAAEREQAERMRLDRAPRRRARWADFGGIAAVALLAFGVAWPALAHMRQSAMRSRCANNLRELSAGLVSYAADHRDALPMSASMIARHAPRPVILDWGAYDHGANLQSLSVQGYCGHHHINCPGCTAKSGRRAFAMQVPWADRPFLLRVVGARPLVADANPVLELRRAGRPVGASLSSWNHSQKGQNVLFGDGSVRWLVVPVVNGDNIFLPVGVDRADRMPNLVELPFAGDGFLAQ